MFPNKNSDHQILPFCYNVIDYEADFAELESESSFCTDKFIIIAAHFSITKR